jgi:hypothetical protein
MKVVASEEAAAFVRAHGGRLFVWTSPRRCCSGAITFLATGSEPAAGRSFREVEAEGFELRFSSGGLAPPSELHLDLKGRRHPHVEAYWDGCVFAA